MTTTNSTDDDAAIAWLAHQRPDVAHADGSSLSRARADFIAHAVAERRHAPRVRERRWRWVSMLTATAATVAAAFVGITATGDDGAMNPPVQPEPASLELVADRVRALPAPAGNATIVVRSHTYPDDRSMRIAELFTDAGASYGADTDQQLRDAVRNGARLDAIPKQVVDLVASAATGDVVAIRSELGALVPIATAANPAAPVPADPTVDEATAKKLSGGPVRSASEQRASRLWLQVMDALTAGAGRPDVREGAVRLLGTLPNVQVTPGSVDGRQALVLRNTDFPDRYEEVLTIDATDGTPLRFSGGTIDAPPSVTVNYDVRRITVARFLAQG